MPIRASSARVRRALPSGYPTPPEHDFSVLNGIRVGAIRTSLCRRHLVDFAREKDFTYEEFVYDTETELLEALHSGAVDAIVGNSLRRSAGEKTIATFSPVNFAVLTRKDDTKLLTEINYGIAQMDASEPDWRGSLYYRNFVGPLRPSIAFTRHADIRHPEVLADTTKIRQILTNILSNAVKYTPAGAVRFAAFERPAANPDDLTLVCEVSDTGIGISPEFLPHLFEQFERERSTTEGGIEGTGLGLAIVKKLTELLGGTIRVESRPGKGSVFTVTLTLRRCAAKPEGAAPQQPVAPIDLCGKRLLLAEDNDLNAEIALEVLKSAGLAVDRVKDGVECLERLEKAPSDTYAVVLMDMQMPRLDGCRAARAIRQMKDEAVRSLPIIALTANAFAEDREKAIAAGMTDFVAKPVNFATLLAAIRTATSR